MIQLNFTRVKIAFLEMYFFSLAFLPSQLKHFCGLKALAMAEGLP